MWLLYQDSLSLLGMPDVSMYKKDKNLVLPAPIELAAGM